MEPIHGTNGVNRFGSILHAPSAPPRVIAVSELGLAAALWTLGFAPKSCQTVNGRVTWLYEDAQLVTEAIRDYRSGVLKISARSYNRAIREFQGELRDLRQESR